MNNPQQEQESKIIISASFKALSPLFATIAIGISALWFQINDLNADYTKKFVDQSKRIGMLEGQQMAVQRMHKDIIVVLQTALATNLTKEEKKQLLQLVN